MLIDTMHHVLNGELMVRNVQFRLCALERARLQSRRTR